MKKVNNVASLEIINLVTGDFGMKDSHHQNSNEEQAGSEHPLIETLKKMTHDEVTGIGHSIHQMLQSRRQTAFQRFPVTFTLLGTFGLIATFYGFQGLVDQVQYFQSNPEVVLIGGVMVLFLTGRLHRELGNE